MQSKQRTPAADDPPPTELTTDSDAIDTGLNDSDLGDPDGTGTTSPEFSDGERRWEEAVEKAKPSETSETPQASGVGLAVLSGVAGAAMVTLLNEGARRLTPAAPRLDLLGMRGIARGMREADQEPPPSQTLFWAALAGDLVSNSLYYSLVGTKGGGAAWGRGALLGLAAGVGAATLPAPLGLGREPTQRSGATRAMTVGWYLAGGLTAAAARRLGRQV